MDGNSVLVHVDSFKPYFYFAAPQNFTLLHLPDLKTALKTHCELVNMQSVYGYSPAPVLFIRVYANSHAGMLNLKKQVEAGVDLPGFGMVRCTQPFESNIPDLLRFMIDRKIQGCSWLTLPHGKYRVRSENQKISFCQIEVEISAHDIISHQPENEYSKIAPLRILSFDIECAGRKGVFPTPEIDSVIQIASVVCLQGSTTPIIRTVFTLDTCANIAGAQTLSFESESDLLFAWKEFVCVVDPDIVTGYNIQNFDFPYLLDRAEHLKVSSFPYLGRIRESTTKAKDTRFSSKAFGTRQNKSINLDGRLQLDMLQYILREHKLRSYSLNSVCAHFLGEQKEDVHYSIITDLQNGTAETRRRLAIYCLKDALLPLRLLQKLMCVINLIEMARVTGVPFNYLLTRGQQIKVVSQLFRRAKEEKLVVPAMDSQGSDEQYEGAT
ncbi:DNA-directed DNA polymerase delta, partial [Nowakowskiella sp. JEL0407]